MPIWRENPMLGIEPDARPALKYDRGDPRSFLRAQMDCEALPLQVRTAAARELLPYCHPKLAAVVTTSISGGDFGAMLERARMRAGLTPPMRLLPPPVPVPNERAPSEEGPHPVTADRRFRR